MNSIWNKILLYGSAIILLFGAILFAIGHHNLQEQPFKEEYFSEEPSAISLTLDKDTTVTQRYKNHADRLKGVTLRFTTYAKEFHEGEVKIDLKNEKGRILATAKIDGESIPDNQDVYIPFPNEVAVNRKEYVQYDISSSVTDGSEYLSLWLSDEKKGCEATWNGEKLHNIIYMIPDGYRDAQFIIRYCIFIGSVFMALLLFCLIGKRQDKKKKLTPSNEIVHIFDQYRFLLKELVGRDFAVKYRRSYLGLVWVVLNPLLTMIVMSSVFSYIFRLQIQNYAVYLILGNITFSCFSEITQLGTQSIVGNGQIIKKVYIPKYIFPLSKALFAFFNFILTLIPAMIVILYYRIPITINYLLLPIVLAGLFMFALGIGFFLSALQVFMRDTQYLYTILLTLWTYLTPIFYSEESLAPILMKLMQFNPMYTYILCIRRIMLYGVTPTVFQLMACIWMGIAALIIGIKYFFNKQSKFILHI